MELSRTPSTVFLPRKSHFVCGVDLGQSQDCTAIAVIEHITGVLDSGSDHDRHTGWPTPQKKAERVDVRFLERLALGLSYPAQVQHVARLLVGPPLCGGDNQKPAELVVDQTGVGAPVADLFDAAGLRPIRISIMAGADATPQGARRWHVAKQVLISTLDARLHVGELRFAASLREAPALAEELKDFRRHVSAAGRYSYEARVGKHDDLVLAVALALWWAVQPPPAQASWGVYGITGGN